MEAIVFLVIISMVISSLKKNSDEAKKKEKARREAQGLPSKKPTPKRRVVGFPGTLGEWIAQLEEQNKGEEEKRTAQPDAPPPPPQPEPGMPRTEPWRPTEPHVMEPHVMEPHVMEPHRMESRLVELPMQQMGSEGCSMPDPYCEAPHSQLRRQAPAPERREPVGQGFPSFLPEDLPEVARGVIYAEILTRPKHRRRLRP